MIIKLVFLIICISLFFVPSIELEEGFVSLFNISMGSIYPFEGQLYVISVLILPVIMIPFVIFKKFMPLLFLGIISLVLVMLVTLFIGHGIEFRDYILNRTSQFVLWLKGGIWILLVLTLLAEKKQKVENIDPPYNRTQKLVISSILLAVGVIIAVTMRPLNIPIAGVNVLNISFSGFAHNVTAIFFGPFFGGAARGLSDIISFIISPRPPFLIAITLTAVLRGALIGFLWQKVRDINTSKFTLFYTLSFGILFIIGLVNILTWYVFPYSEFAISQIPPTEGAAVALSYGFLIAAILGLILKYAILIYSKKIKDDTFYIRFLKLFVAIVFPGLLSNALNTYIIFVSIVGPATLGIGIMYFFVPRFFEELVTSTISVYVMVLVMGLYERTIRRKVVQKN